MIDEQLHDTIEKYLLGELSEAERTRLKADMAADPALRGQVEVQRLVLMGMRRLAAADLRKKFEQWDKEIETPPPPRRNLWIWSTIALLLLLTAGAFWHFRQIEKERQKQEQEKQVLLRRDSLIAALQTDLQQKTEELAALPESPGANRDSFDKLEISRLKKEMTRKEKESRDLENSRLAGYRAVAMLLAPPSIHATRGEQGGGDSIFVAAQKAYNAEDFDAAIRLLKRLPPYDARAQRVVTKLLPYALFYDRRFRDAIHAFLLLKERQPVYETAEAQGYLLLCYLAEGRFPEAREMRDAILRNPEHKHYQMAKDLSKLSMF